MRGGVFGALLTACAASAMMAAACQGTVLPAIHVVGALPALPSAYDRTVATAAELRQAIADIGTTLPQGAVIGVTADIDLGSTNRSTGGFTDTTLYILDRSCTIVPVAGYGSYDTNPMGDGKCWAHRFARTRTISGFITASATGTRRTVTIRGFKRTLNNFPALGDQTTGQTWYDVGCCYKGDGTTADSTNNSIFGLDTIVNNVNYSLSANEYYLGIDINHTPFPLRTKLIDSNSPASWQLRTDGGIAPAGGTNTYGTVYAGHGDATWVRFNRHINGPRGIYVNNWSGSSADLGFNYFHDLNTGLKIYATGGGSRQDVDLHHNEFDRTYTDDTQCSQDAASKCVYHRHGNFYGRGVGNSRDNANPHGDRKQYFLNATTATPRVVAHHRDWSEFSWNSYQDRTSKQTMYFQGGNPLYEQKGWEAHNIIALNPMKLWSMMSGFGTLLRNIIGINQDNARPNDPNPPGRANIQMERASNGAGGFMPNSLSLIQNVIHEGFYSTGTSSNDRQFVRVNYKDFPYPQTGRLAQINAEFADLQREIETPNDAFLAVTQKAAAGSNILSEFASLEDFMTAPQPDIAWLGFPSLTDLDLNTQYEVDAYVHGIEGNARAISAISSGLEAKAIDVYTNADITSYGTSNFTAHAGELVRVRFTTPATELTEVTKTITHEGVPVNITYTTKATTLYALAHFANANINKAGGIGSIDTTKMSMFFDFVFKQNDANQYVFILATGTNISCNFTSAETLSLLFRVSGVTQASIVLPASTFANNQRYQVHVMIDTSLYDTDTGLDDPTQAVRVWLNGVEVASFSTQAYTRDGTLKFGLASTWYLFNNSSSGSPFIGDLGALIVWPGVAYDWSDANVRKKTSPLLIGSDGSGIDGTPAKIFIRGDATKINGASTANDGTGGAFDNTGTDVT